VSKIGKEQIVQLQKKHGSDQAIASRLGTSRQAIYKLRKEYGIPALKDRHLRRDSEIKRLHSTGISPIQLAVRFELSQTQIYRILNINKVRKTMKQTKPEVFNDAQELVAVLAPFRAKGKTVVTTNGCFDLLHAGHLQYLREAAELGDILIIGINSDASVRRLKGENRPLQNEIDRATLMAALKPVDYTLIFEEDDPCAFLDILQPDIHVKGGDYLPGNLPEKVIVENHGGRIEILSFKNGHSTTGIVEKILEK